MIGALGAIMVATSWVAVGVILSKWRGNNGMSISQHAASARNAHWVFAMTLIVGGGIFYYWLVVWFTPKLGLPLTFVALLTLAVAAQMIAGAVPDTVNWKRRVHRITSYAMAVLFVPLTVYILFAPHISTMARGIGIGCLSYMVGAFFLIILLKRARAHYLIFQALYVVAFQIVILAAAYL
jgi:hypothetical protein